MKQAAIKFLKRFNTVVWGAIVVIELYRRLRGLK